ncbi:hypothetical protein SAMN05421835_10565 [Amycolatopsis sacchari]|uniref:Zinc-binding dehydrogenase n=1 Tax=Amycolatopsis sacchari TaxID=115433 RepID=A0A1I3QYN4_9PSEU|nr:hypothetical protein SAMN05421835_10565 [Amycolatopsis sacchari]
MRVAGTAFNPVDGVIRAGFLFVVAPAEVLTSAPATVPLTDAAALPSAALTAWQALFEHAQVQSGQRVLINGAGGGVGGYTIQFAVRTGATRARGRGLHRDPAHGSGDRTGRRTGQPRAHEQGERGAFRGRVVLAP